MFAASLPTARRAIVPQFGDADARRAALPPPTTNPGDKLNEDAKGLHEAMQRAFDEAAENLAVPSTSEQVNRFLERFTGPMTMRHDGMLTPQSEQPPANAEG